jgi:hypothetical protein
MAGTYISAQYRRIVAARCEGLCEYCLIAEADTRFGCAIDHIISEKHGGATDPANLANACMNCNVAKGTDIGSIHWESDQFLRFFNPRKDTWREHFVLRGVRIEPLTRIGAVTARILQFNDAERIKERQVLANWGHYPTEGARLRMHPPSE